MAAESIGENIGAVEELQAEIEVRRGILLERRHQILGLILECDEEALAIDRAKQALGVGVFDGPQESRARESEDEWLSHLPPERRLGLTDLFESLRERSRRLQNNQRRQDTVRKPLGLTRGN